MLCGSERVTNTFCTLDTRHLHIFIVRPPLRGPTKPLSPRAQWQVKAGLPPPVVASMLNIP